MPTFQPDQFLEKLEASVTSWDFKPTVEIGSVIPRERRTVGRNRFAASHGMSERLDRALNHSSHSLGKGGRAKNTQTRQAKGWRRDIPQDQTLEVTFRIVGFGTKLQVSRNDFCVHASCLISTIFRRFCQLHGRRKCCPLIHTPLSRFYAHANALARTHTCLSTCNSACKLTESYTGHASS